MTLLEFLYISFPFGIATSATIRVGNLLGAGRPHEARIAGGCSGGAPPSACSAPECTRTASRIVPIRATSTRAWDSERRCHGATDLWRIKADLQSELGQLLQIRSTLNTAPFIVMQSRRRHHLHRHRHRLPGHRGGHHPRVPQLHRLPVCRQRRRGGCRGVHLPDRCRLPDTRRRAGHHWRRPQVLRILGNACICGYPAAAGRLRCEKLPVQILFTSWGLEPGEVG